MPTITQSLETALQGHTSTMNDLASQARRITAQVAALKAERDSLSELAALHARQRDEATARVGTLVGALNVYAADQRALTAQRDTLRDVLLALAHDEQTLTKLGHKLLPGWDEGGKEGDDTGPSLFELVQARINEIAGGTP